MGGSRKAGLGTVIVTGGASGLGAAVAEAIEARGGAPVVIDRVPPLNGFEHEVVDLTAPRSAEDAVRRVAERHGGLAGVVAAAGTDACGRLDEVPSDTWERVIAVNLVGNVAVVRAALPFLERQRGRVVMVGSTLGLRALGDATAYCASKFAVTGFTRALAAEAAGRVGVSLLIPGGMDTAFFDGRDEQYRPPADAMLNRPADVASTVVFALEMPVDCELRELVVCPAVEPSWPP
jgi:NAD(P)-dependent dehydrogenase (short-subunit alcohol dehydrogenase family)